MRDYRDAKAMAQSLRQALAARAVTITHSDSLELIAKSFGLDNWNVLAARIGDGPAPPAADAASPPARSACVCSFCGRSQHAVAKLVAGPDSFICDICVGLCAEVIDRGFLVKAILAAGADPADTEPYQVARRLLSGWTTEQLAAYRDSGESQSRRTREKIARLTDHLAGRETVPAGPAAGAEAEFQAFLRASSDEALIAQKRRMERRLTEDEAVLGLAVAILESRATR